MLIPKLVKRDNVFSFFDYDVLEFFNKYKYHKRGDLVYKILARPFREFALNFEYKAYVIPIDDNPKKGFSHTAILAKALHSKYLNPIFGSLIATSDVKYAGKSLEFRLKNPRNFIYLGKKNIDVILVDDIKTTGITIKEAIKTLEKYNVNVLFSVVLSDKSCR
ncbi:ComF family protein [Caminibacter profundus]